MNELLIGLLAGATLLTVIVAVFSGRSDLKRHVAALDTAHLGSGSANREMLAKLVSEADRTKLQQRFVEAGWYKTSLVKFFVLSGLGFVAGIICGFAIITYLQRSGPAFTALVVVVGFAGAMLPNFVLNKAIADRKLAIQRTLPDLLDMVSTTVEAGVALNSALLMSLDAIRGPLADELREVLADVRIGQSRTDALTAMAQRVKQIDLTSTVMAMVQTEKLGGNIGHVLDELALEARQRRLMRAEEKAAQLPVKMVIPMALFMLPALFVMIFGPVAADLMQKFK